MRYALFCHLVVHCLCTTISIKLFINVACDRTNNLHTIDTRRIVPFYYHRNVQRLTSYSPDDVLLSVNINRTR